MGNNQTLLENLLKAVENKGVYEIKASDGKTYLCEFLKHKHLNKTSFDKMPVIKDKDKQKAKENLIKHLAEKNLNADIIEESESNYVNPNYLYYDSLVKRFYTNYTISVYKIKRQL